MNEDEEIVGIIYPVMQNNFDILKERKNPAYVKFITHVKSKNPTRLRKGHYLLFYLSRKDKSIIGYAKINAVSFKTAFEINDKYLNRIQMEQKEFDGYILDRESKQLLFLELEEIIVLDKPMPVDYPITMAGQYVSINEMKRLLGVDVLE